MLGPESECQILWQSNTTINDPTRLETMPKVPFKYHSFWDVPRFIVCSVEGTELLLDASFDDALDEYAPDYKVYVGPPELDPASLYWWARSPASESSYIGSIPVNEIEFDSSKRQEIGTGPLLLLLLQERDAGSKPPMKAGSPHE
jgi:hypothetical protein